MSTGEQTDRILSWVKAGIVLITAITAFAYGWWDLRQNVRLIDARLVRIELMEARLERLEHTMVCVLWEIEPENCESARRP